MFEQPTSKPITHSRSFFLLSTFFILLTALKNGHRAIRPFASNPVNNSRGISSPTEITVERDQKPIPHSYMNQNQHEQEDQQYEENIKKSILENALQFVTKSGWSVESLSSGAKAAGYPTITHGLFPNGGGDLVHYFNIKCNEQLVDDMKTVSEFMICTFYFLLLSFII